MGLIEIVEILRDRHDQALQARIPARSRALTAHQTRVWELIAAGTSQAEIAVAVGSKPGTIKTDVKRLKAKLGVDSTEGLKRAYRWRATP